MLLDYVLWDYVRLMVGPRSGKSPGGGNTGGSKKS